MMADNKKSILLILALPVILALTSLGCGLAGLINRDRVAADGPTPTRTAMPTFTPTATGESFIKVAVADTPPENPQPQGAAESSQPDTPAAEVAQEEPSPTPPPVPTDTPVPTATENEAPS